MDRDGSAGLPFEDAVEAVLRSLRPGDVVTYGEVAAEAGAPGAARAVGRFLSRSGADVPWWRVVTANGRLVPGHEEEHARRLAAEGVATSGGRLRLAGKRRSRSASRPGADHERVSDV